MRWFTKQRAGAWVTVSWPRVRPILAVPKKEQLQLKKPLGVAGISEKGMTSVDLEKLCTGNAMYGMDARLDGMVYASVEHPPVFGGVIKTLDDQEALKVAGVHQTIRIDPFKPPRCLPASRRSWL